MTIVKSKRVAVTHISEAKKARELLPFIDFSKEDWREWMKDLGYTEATIRLVESLRG